MSKLVRSNQARMEVHIDEDRLAELRSQFVAGHVTRYVIRPLLMAVLIATLTIAMLAVIVAVVGDTRWFNLVVLFFFIALEAIYTTNWLNQPRQLPIDHNAYRAAELLLLLVLVRLVSWIIFGEGMPDLDLLQEFLRAPQVLFLNAPFLVTLLLSIIAWRLATVLSQIFCRLEVSEYELRFQSLPPAQRKARADDKPIHVGRSELVQAYTRFWLLGGVLMVVGVGLSTLEQQTTRTLLAPLVAARANLEPPLLAALMLYFIAGLWLLSQARLMQASARWLVNNLQTDKNARRNWQGASVVLLLLVFLIAAFVPIGSTSTLSQMVDAILYVLFFIANVLIFLVTLPFALLLALFGGQGSAEPERLLRPLEPPPMMEQGAITPSPLAETVSMVLSSGFWAVFVVVVVIALLTFLRERKPQAGAAEAKSLWDQLMAWLHELLARLRGRARTARQTLSTAFDRPSKPAQPSPKQGRWRFLRLSGLSPRDQIRYFYLSTVRRAGEQGVTRPPSDTPVEFEEVLKAHWPDADQEIDELTEAFLQARYSAEEITEKDLPRVKDTWKSVRRQLRRHSGAKGEDLSDEDRED